VRVLQHTMPVAVPGVTFLSGGMGEEDATISLNEINKFEGKKPWALTFSYGRALQQSVLHVWKGKAENVKAAQTELINRARANGQASLGQYKGGAGGALAKASLHVAGYVY
jgi:fructose-bisphosphate aldolase class I